MSNTDIDNRIKAIYQADINSIRNLSKLANNLINDGKLVVPGGLEIVGNLVVKDNVTMQKKLEVQDKVTMQQELEVKDKVTMQKELEVKDNVTMQKELEVKDNVAIKKGLTMGGAINSSDLTTKRNLIKTNLTSKISDINKELKNYVKNGDGIYIKKGSQFLNSTKYGDSSHPSSYGGWTYWRKNHDGDSNLTIVKR